ncbi:MAG: redoxin domain-containing protein [Clostridia bacterium]|nr:redoxin domain-containing protein [Clostridia bacterium]
MNKRKVLEIVAWSLAGAVLVGGLAYFNFVDKPIVSGVEIGDECPDFTVQAYRAENGKFTLSEEQITLSECRGKIVVVNFWATWCTSCIAELPDFNKFQEDHQSDVVVLALNHEYYATAEFVSNWMDKNQPTWADYQLLFGRYEEDNDVYKALGFTSGALPGTMIVNREGMIVYRKDGLMHYEDLQAEIGPLLKL